MVISQKELKELLDYDPETGIFRWKVKPSAKVAMGSTAGHLTNSGYWGIKINGYRYGAHRLVWLYVYGKWPIYQIDHINGNPIDNRLCNLRDISVRENGQNLPIHRSGRLCGCSPTTSGKWEARIKIRGVKHYLGTFTTEEEAHTRYKLECFRIEIMGDNHGK